MTEQIIYCKRCGRKLKGAISKKIGYGPECFKKIKPKNKNIMEGNNGGNNESSND